MRKSKEKLSRGTREEKRRERVSDMEATPTCTASSKIRPWPAAEAQGRDHGRRRQLKVVGMVTQILPARPRLCGARRIWNEESKLRVDLLVHESVMNTNLGN
jgi:hypothetical protein